MNATRILVPVNVGKNCADALEFVAGLAGETPVSITLLYVVNLNISLLDQRIYDELYRENRQRLEILSNLFFAEQSPTLSVRVGKPHEEILSEAHETNAEIIVLADSKPRQKRWRFGLTTLEHVVRRAPCLTLVLPQTWKTTPERYRQAMRPASTAASIWPQPVGQN